MDVLQLLLLKESNTPRNYLQNSTPVPQQSQIDALRNSVNIYLNSECVDQTSLAVKNVKSVLNSDIKNVDNYVHNLLYAVVYEHLLCVLPKDNVYHYDAGTCKSGCGLGANPVVAVLATQMIRSNIALEDIDNFPDQMLLQQWTAFKSLVAQQPHVISYNSNPVCKVK